MRKVALGRTGLNITPLVFGTLPMGPLQANLSPKEGGKLIRYAMDRGVNFLDTAEMYGTYPHMREGLKGFSGEVFINSKTHAADAATARSHVEKALRELERDHLDSLLVHGARLSDPFRERGEVFEEICRMRDEGLVRNAGLSSHYISSIRAAAQHSEIDVIHPLINREGMGIMDGGAVEMADIIKQAGEAGKGVYAMKALAGGNLISEARDCISWVMGLPGVNGLALGMLSEAEIEANLSLVCEGNAPDQVWTDLEKGRRRITIMRQFCTGCGACIEVCASDAIFMEDEKANVDDSKCILCGYCASACPDFIIRVT